MERFEPHQKVSDGNGVLVNYTYLADGTKIRAVDADGEELEYRGSLTFRRWFNSPIPGKGKFLKGLCETQLDNMIDDAVKLGTKVKNNTKNGGFAYIYDFGQTIGINRDGNPSSIIKVIIDKNNNLVTAYPI